MTIIVGICSVLQARAQGTISFGGYAAARAGWNTSATALSRGDLGFAALPDMGIEAAYSLNSAKDALLVLDVGFQNASAKSVSLDPFTGRATNEFQMHGQLQALTGAVRMRFLKFLNIVPEFGLFMRGALPLSMSYRATVDVFEAQSRNVAPPTGELKTFQMPRDRLLPYFEIGAELGLLTIPIGEGRLTLYGEGSFTLVQTLRFLPLSQLPDNYNIVGLDPLAGYRTLNFQPVMIALGLRYLIDVGTLGQ